MTRLPINAGSASAATSFAIALARFADVIAGKVFLLLCFQLFFCGYSGGLRLVARKRGNLTNGLECRRAIFRLHTRLDGVRVERSGLFPLASRVGSSPTGRRRLEQTVEPIACTLFDVFIER